MVEPQPHDNPAPVLGPFRGTFVGRQREIGELRIALEDAVSGKGRLVMLVGEPGIGKTRTCTQELELLWNQRATKGDRAKVLDRSETAENAARVVMKGR